MSHRPQAVAGQANEEKTGRLEAFSDGLWSIRAISSRDERRGLNRARSRVMSPADRNIPIMGKQLRLLGGRKLER